MSMTIELSRDHGLCMAVVVGYWLLQGIVLSIPVGIARKKYGVSPPQLYLTNADVAERKDIKDAVKITKEDVIAYNSVQRSHQNNMEFMVAFMPVFLCGAIVQPRESAIAGAFSLLARTMSCFGYQYAPNGRLIGAWGYVPIFYIIYIVGKSAHELIM